jgi:hypothetical protein
MRVDSKGIGLGIRIEATGYHDNSNSAANPSLQGIYQNSTLTSYARSMQQHDHNILVP